MSEHISCNDQLLWAVSFHLTDGSEVRANPTEPMEAADLAKLRTLLDQRIDPTPSEQTPHPGRCFKIGSADEGSFVPAAQIVRISWRRWQGPDQPL